MAASTADSPCWLLNLPNEMKISIINHIDKKRDLYNLSLTCRVLEDMTVTRLYESVDVEVAQTRAQGWDFGDVPTFRPQVIRAMRNLSIRNGLMDIRNPVYSRGRRSDAGSTDAYACDIIGRIPPNQLSAFAFLHRTPISLRTLDLLAYHHGNALRQLSLYEVEVVQESVKNFPRNLTSLECRSVNEGAALKKLVEANKNTLEKLRMGQEKNLIEQYRRTRIGFLEQIPQPLESFMDIIQLQNLPNLKDLALYGLDVSPLIPSDPQQALVFCNIHRLTLESCFGSAELLESLGATFHYARNAPNAPRPRVVPQLKDFLFRNEAPSNRLKDSLIRFLASFSGLETLSLLFENATFLERVPALIAEHGPTLHTLVLESRIQPRENLGLDTSRPFGIGSYSQELWEESITDICRLCPNLVELGTGFPWDDEIVRLRKTPLPTLLKLRTIHIRNFPESQVLSQLGDYSIKEYATKFIEWVFPALVGGARPSLETLAIGPTLYESRWRSSGTRRQPPEFLRTHHFCLDWAKTRFGRWSPLITGVSEKYMEDALAQKPLGGVFEQVWLK